MVIMSLQISLPLYNCQYKNKQYQLLKHTILQNISLIIDRTGDYLHLILKTSSKRIISKNYEQVVYMRVGPWGQSGHVQK